MVIANISARWHQVGWLSRAPLFGIGPGNLGVLCDDIIAGSSPCTIAILTRITTTSRCLVRLALSGSTGGLFLVSVIWACAKPAMRDRSNVVVATCGSCLLPFHNPSRLPPISLASGTTSLCGVRWPWRWRARRIAARISQTPKT